jgi:hypothetical protein
LLQRPEEQNLAHFRVALGATQLPVKVVAGMEQLSAGRVFIVDDDPGGERRRACATKASLASALSSAPDLCSNPTSLNADIAFGASATSDPHALALAVLVGLLERKHVVRRPSQQFKVLIARRLKGLRRFQPHDIGADSRHALEKEGRAERAPAHLVHQVRGADLLHPHYL